MIVLLKRRANIMADFKYISKISEICPNLKKTLGEECLRLIKGDKPKKEDFIPHYYAIKRNFKEKECLAKGISLFTDLKDIKTLFELIPNLRKKYKSIYKGKIESSHGELYNTLSNKKPSHKTFYAYKTCKEVDIFDKRISYDF